MYALGAGASKDAWYEGAERLEGRGMVAKVEGGGYGMLGGGMGGGGGMAAMRPAGEGMAVTASLGRPTSGTTNNLDRLLTRQVQVQLARQGVRFDDQPYLATREWRGGTCDVERRSAMTARTQTEWEKVWGLVADAEGARAPEIDFTRDMALAAFGGEAWAGDSVRIADVWEDDEGLHARIERGAEDEASTSPYHIVVVSRYEGEVTWK